MVIGAINKNNSFQNYNLIFLNIAQYDALKNERTLILRNYHPMFMIECQKQIFWGCTFFNEGNVGCCSFIKKQTNKQTNPKIKEESAHNIFIIFKYYCLE